MEESSLEKRMNISLRRERKPSCTLCKNHGMRSNLKGHKRHCPFSNCDCEPCVKGRQRRVVMREQVRLRRKQMKDIESRSNSVAPVEPFQVNFSLAAVKTELSLPPTNEHRSFGDEKELAIMKHCGRNEGLTHSVSNILHSQFSVPRQQSFNCSAYMPTPFQLRWNTRDVFSGFPSYNN
ncbi:doublesex- and mab-3-related transcription factor A2-like, partial [Orbicella faveolata]|uniref:doublesex- and mab-3-related transcription factor A2-like n=1 Tax=Orbicella faveolata TaxID=48498 RepID=UPI0009E4C70E